jgi:hypothetical protein
VEVFASWADWAGAERALAARLPAPTVAALARAYDFAWVTKPEGADAGLRQRYLAGFASAPADVLTIKLSDRYSNVQRLHTHPRPAKRASYYAETVRHVLPLAERSPYFRERFGRWAAHFAPQLGGS